MARSGETGAAAVLLLPAAWTIYVLITAWWGKSRHWGCDPPTTPTTAGGDIHIHVHPKESVEALHSSANVSDGSWDTGNADDLFQPAPGFGRSQAQRSLQGSEAACKLRSDAPDSYRPTCFNQKTKAACEVFQLTCVWDDGSPPPPPPPPPPPSPLAELVKDEGKADGEQLLHVIIMAMLYQTAVWFVPSILLCCGLWLDDSSMSMGLLGGRSRRNQREGPCKGLAAFCLVLILCGWVMSMSTLGSNLFGTVGSNCEAYGGPHFQDLITDLKVYFWIIFSVVGVVVFGTGLAVCGCIEGSWGCDDVCCCDLS